MASFYAVYANAAASSGSTTVTGPLGQQAMATSVSVAVASDQTPVPVTGTITATNPSVGTTGAAVPASATQIGGSDGTNLRTVKVSAAGVVSVDGSATTQPVSGTVTANAGSGTFAVSAAALPLPAGASTSANQTTANASLASIDGKLGSLGQKTMAASAPVVIASDQSAVPVSGTVAVSNFPATQPVSGTVTANAGSGTFAVSAAALPLPAGAATAAKQPALGVAGTASADVLTVQGIASMTALKVDGSAVTQPVSGTVSVGNTVTVSAIQNSSPWIVAGGGTAGSPTSGVLTVQGIASMTALKVDGSAVTQPVSGTVTANAGTGTFTTDQVATTSATFQDGSIAFGSLTTSFATVITTAGALKNVMLRNNTDAVVVVSLNGGGATSYTLDSGDSISLDLKTLGLNIPNTTALQAKYSGSAPTLGSIRINGVY